MPAEKEPQRKQKQAFEVIFGFHGAIFIRVFFLWYKGIVRRQKVCCGRFENRRKESLDFSFGTFRLWFGFV